MYNNVHFCNYIKFDIVSTVPPPPLPPFCCRGGLNLQPNFQKMGVLTGPQLFEGGGGGDGEEGVTFFRGVAIVT